MTNNSNNKNKKDVYSIEKLYVGEKTVSELLKEIIISNFSSKNFH